MVKDINEFILNNKSFLCRFPFELRHTFYYKFVWDTEKGNRQIIKNSHQKTKYSSTPLIVVILGKWTQSA